MVDHKPLIGIPCFQDTFPAQKRPRFAMYQTYTSALEAADAIPVLLPLQSSESLRKAAGRLDGLLLAGGDDMNPARYGQPPHPKTELPDDKRDGAELDLARWAVDTNTPLFAICRGMQTLNVAFGGTLLQHIPDQVPAAIQHEYNYEDYHQRHLATHEIQIVPDTRLEGILGTSAAVNSFHHQAVAQLAPVFQATACAPDGVVEALEGRDRSFVLAVQWHPEDMFHADARMLALFRAFVDAVNANIKLT